MNLATTALLALPLVGCAGTQFRVQVDGTADGRAQGLETYVLEVDHEVDALIWQEYASTVRNAMKASGFREADEGIRAHFLLRVAYGISGPDEYQYTYSDPVYGQTGTTTRYDPYTGDKTTEAVYGTTHYVDRTATGVAYNRKLDLIAHAISPFGEVSETPIWHAAMFSRGSSGDLRRVFPYLVAAGQPYFGKSTGQQIEVTIDEGDEKVAALVNGR